VAQFKFLSGLVPRNCPEINREKTVPKKRTYLQSYPKKTDIFRSLGDNRLVPQHFLLSQFRKSEGRKSMTILTGIICADAIVMGADS
jgi:hypothetical protein